MRYSDTLRPSVNLSRFRQSLASLTGIDVAESREKPPLKVASAPLPTSHFLESHPEFHLLLEFFRYSINSAINYRNIAEEWRGVSADMRNNTLEALAWVISPEKQWFYSLHLIADFLNLDPDNIRRQILDKAGLTHDEVRAILLSEGWECPPDQHPRRSKRRIRRKHR